jgi:HK97 family phage major capsid protein
MANLQEILAAIDGMNTAWAEFTKVNDQKIDAIKNGHDGRARELDEKVDRIGKDITKFSSLKEVLEREHKFLTERIESLEASASSPGRTALVRMREEHTRSFLAAVRHKFEDTSLNAKVQDLQKQLWDQKDITIGTPAAGGYAVPEEISREIGRLELLFSPVRELVKVVNVGTSDYKELVNRRGLTSGWVGETGPRPATATPTLRERMPTQGEIYAYPQVSEWSLDDIFFNVENWLADEVAQRFAQEEGTAVISGNGTSKPTGILNTSPVATADFASPERSPNAIQLVTSDLTPGGVGILGDALIDLVYTLNSAYRAGSSFVMNSLSTAGVRKLKDTTGQYLWQPSLQSGQPDMLLGYPVVTWEQMPNIGANAFPVLFGNFKRGYTLVDRVGLRITRDNVTNIGYVRFYVRRREGGILIDNHAIKALQTL